MIKSAKIDQQDTGYSENDEEGIVLFKKSGLCPVMILVQVPQKTMHHKFMGTPGESLHDNECSDEDEYIIKYLHLLSKLIPLHHLG
jgi:hypothetical protein